jgi:hypothetical protein
MSCQTCNANGGDNNATMMWNRVENEMTDNTCPVWMADGRSFGDIVYQPRCDQQYKSTLNKFNSSFDYRQYLIQNAEQLMKENSKVATTKLQNW